MGKLLSAPKIHIDCDKEVEDLWIELLPLIESKEWSIVNSKLLNESSVITAITEKNYSKMITGQPDVVTPLQVALMYQAPIFIISLLLSISPKALFIKDSTLERYTPLFRLISNAADDFSTTKFLKSNNSSNHTKGLTSSRKYFNRDLLQLFLAKDTSCLKVVDNDGLLPLHKALECRIESELIIMIIQADPNSVCVKTTLGKLPLHYATEFKASPEVIKLLLQYHPEALMESHDRRLPLHYAVEYRCVPAVIELLLHHKTSTTSSESAIIQISSGVQTRTYDGMLPIHLAVQHQASIEVISLLVKEYANGLIQKDRLTKIPLHYALEKQLSEPIIQLLVSSNPESVAFRNRGSPGNYPLSTAIEHHYSHHIIQLLVSAYPNAVKEPNIKGMLPLRAALRHSSSTAFKYRAETVSLLLQNYPDAAKELDEHNRIALHYAISRNMPIEIIASLVEAYPEGVRIVDKNGQIPLHLAVKRNIQLISIECLLKKYPDGALQIDKYGFNCLNYAIENDVSADIYEVLLKANMKCAEHCIKGKTVLHHAVEFKRNFKVIKMIVDAFPQAAAIQEPMEGRLPLHWAIERLLELDILLCIDNANPKEGAYVKNLRGWCSIHYAIHYPTPVEIVQRILIAYPSIVKDLSFPLHLQYQKEENKINLVKDDNSPLKTYPSEILNINSTLYNQLDSDKQNEEEDNNKIDSPLVDEYIENPIGGNKLDIVNISTNYLLLHYAVDHKALFETVAEILFLNMPYKIDGTFNPQHEDTWAYILGECNDYYWQSIDIVLTRYEHLQDLVRCLSLFTDKLVRKAIDIATPQCLYQISRRLYYCSRYEMQRKPIHISDFSMSYLASDHNILHMKEKLPVILKFSKNRNDFIRELSIREQINFSTDYVIQMTNHYNGQVDSNYRMELLRNNFNDYLYLSVFSAGEKDLFSIINHEYFAGKNDELIKKHCYQILSAVQYIHKEGVVHGNIKPSNFIRQNGVLKLINFGKACRYTYQELVTADLKHLSYTSPELVKLQLSENIKLKKDEKSSSIHSGKVQCSVVDEGKDHLIANDLFTEPDQIGQRILANPSQDMWSIGAILYFLCTGETLFLSNLDEHIDIEQLEILSEWPEFVKQRRLDKIQNPIARNLVSQLLSHDPKLRPSAEYCITKHPYFHRESDALDSTIPSTRFPGMLPQFDVYISYRKEATEKDNQVNSSSLDPTIIKDENHYKIIEHCLVQLGLNVANQLHVDSINKRAHMMVQSSAAILVFSRYALNKSNQSPTKEDQQRKELFGSGPMNFFERMRSTSSFDEFLFELRLATELRSIGLLEKGLFILAIGDASDNIDGNELASNQELEIDPDIWKNIIYTSYFQQYYGEMIGRYGGSHSKSMPDISVVSVETALENFLNQSGYGISLQKDLTLLEMFRYLVRLPTFFIIGPQKRIFETITENISELILGRAVLSTDALNINISGAQVVSDIVLSRPSTAAFDMLLNSRVRTPNIAPRTTSRGKTPQEILTNKERIIKSPLTGLRIRERTPNRDSPRKPSSQQRTTIMSSGNNNSFRMNGAINYFTKSVSSNNSPEKNHFKENKTSLGSPLLSKQQINNNNDTTLSSNHDDSSHLPIKAWGGEDDEEFFHFEQTSNDISYIDVPDNFNNNLPYFTELVGEDKVRTVTALNFMTNKLEISENQIANLQDELALLREKMNSSDAELTQLRNQMSRNSIRYH